MSIKSKNRQKIGFYGAIITMIFVYVASSAPIPIYSLYQTTLSLTESNLSTTAVTYFLGTVISLLFFGKVSDFIGRQKSIIITIAIAIVGCLTFLYVNNYWMFLIARLLQGLACGLASSCVASYIVDSTPQGSSKLAAIATSSSTMIGLAVGVFSSALLLLLNQAYVNLTYVSIIILLVFCAILIIAGEETVKTKSVAIKMIKPTISIPNNVKPLMLCASAVFIGTWAVGGFYQAYSSTIAVDQFGIANPILSAAIFAFLMAPQILGNTLIKYIDTQKAQNIGMVSFTAFMFLITASMIYNNIILFLIFTILSAVAIGLAFASTMERILSNINENQRAGMLSSIYLISYGGPAIINFFVGQINNFNLIEVTIGYLVIVLFATLITLLTCKKQPKSTF